MTYRDTCDDVVVEHKPIKRTYTKREKRKIRKAVKSGKIIIAESPWMKTTLGKDVDLSKVAENMTKTIEMDSKNLKKILEINTTDGMYEKPDEICFNGERYVKK